ncbi:hypothetical protein GUITHDRAFT_140331 [Guillardia theta CCMP2712]|uniref:protein O-GlcNAc transferase n=1 Tax=Guillardia theta (strain CCMP2712) TaxID=905079 RepID=L1J5E2_GUITC|nr:hypothetical protein GUITHDRAFT_140331 [Guillardia theta CCMP2712]EKX43562.1 hypothetical protein GUITHDRAFT_140331 [Guillardia theta CCMP2712]|eukprot:XP_005830542.1 hypothetical protein GUITHDRAFT_140331 [Guillardia theta CCMP2712]
MNVIVVVVVLLTCCVLCPFAIESGSRLEDAERFRKEAERMRLQGESERALKMFQETLRLDSTNSKAYWGIGRILLEHERVEEALPMFREAVTTAEEEKRRDKESTRVTDVALAVMYQDLGVCLGENFRFKEQMKAFERSLSIRYSERTYTNLQRVRQFMCEWRDWDNNMQELERLANRSLHWLPGWQGSNANTIQQSYLLVPPQHALYYPMSPITTLASARFCALLTEREARKLQLKPFRHPQTSWRPKEGVRGYLSSQFAANSFGWTMEHVFSFHDRTRFHVIAFSLSSSDDPTRRSMVEEVEDFKDVNGIDPAGIASAINELQVHVLLDVDGYRDVRVTTGVADNMQVLALRPAPIVVNWLGPCSSSGADFVDFLLSDRLSSPPDFQSHFTESFALLPLSFSVSSLAQSYSNLTRIFSSALLSGYPVLLPRSSLPPDLKTRDSKPTDLQTALKRHGVRREEHGVPAEGLVLADFNKSFKLSPDMFTTWLSLLVALPGSVLVLGEAEEAAKKNIRKEAREAGVDPGRISFPDPHVTHGEHVTRRLPMVLSL